MSTKRSQIPKQTCSWKLVCLKVCLSMCDLLVDTRHWRVNSANSAKILYILKMQSLGDNLGFFFFHSWKSHDLFLRWSTFYILNHSINFKSCDVKMNLYPRGKRVHVWKYILNLELFCNETWSTNRYIYKKWTIVSWTIVLGNIFQDWKD